MTDYLFWWCRRGDHCQVSRLVQEHREGRLEGKDWVKQELSRQDYQTELIRLNYSED